MLLEKEIFNGVHKLRNAVLDWSLARMKSDDYLETQTIKFSPASAVNISQRRWNCFESFHALSFPINSSEFQVILGPKFYNGIIDSEWVGLNGSKSYDFMSHSILSYAI